LISGFRDILCGIMLVNLLFAFAMASAQVGGAPNPQRATVAAVPGTPAKLSSMALTALKEKAQAGDAAAQCDLGRAYEDGNGVSQNYELAAKWYRAAGDQGNAVAQSDLGTLYRSGLGVVHDEQEAVGWYRKAAKQKNANGMFNLATAYYNGDGIVTSDSIAYAWFLLAQEAGSKSAGDAVSRAEAELKPWAIDDGLKRISAMYDKGDELNQDFAESTKWLRKAAMRGDSEAQMGMATRLFVGKGAAIDYGEARHWCEQVAKEGNSQGQFCMGYIYQKGLGMQPDLKEASKWYAQAAMHNNHQAAKALAQIDATGAAGKVDLPAAFLLYITISDKDALREAAKLRNQMTKKEWEALGDQLRSRAIDPEKLDAILKQTSSQ
jgi:hypothetical protein